MTRAVRPPLRRGEARLRDIVDVDPRIEARRAEVRLARLTRRRRQWLLGSLVMTLLAVVYAATRSPLLAVDQVAVTGAARTVPDDVRAASGIRPGSALTDVDGEAVAAAVRALPWVDGATVERNWLGTVTVSVSERSPVLALVAGDGTAALVDDRRRVLAAVPAPPPGLPVVRGLPAAAPGTTLPDAVDGALALSRRLTPGVRTRVEAIDVADGELTLALRPQGRARLGGPDKLDQKMVALQTVFSQVDLTDLCVLDVRVPAQPGLTRDQPCR
jgi:cell division protein FtsQ